MTQTWRPTAELARLRRWADVVGCLRNFFAERGVLEVSTPLLSHATVTDLHLHSLTTTWYGPGVGAPETLYLQTSPEFAMKRLLAAGSGPIYQITKAFRDGEAGRRHNPEFTMLEWYRPGFDHHGLMDEMDELLNAVLGSRAAERLTYAEAVARHADLDPHTAPTATLRERARAAHPGLSSQLDPDDRDLWLQVLMSEVVEPQLGLGRPTFLYDYPASQAALARVRRGPPDVAERFEVYIGGIELANGFHELADPVEQERRFQADLEARRRRGLRDVPIDRNLLDALAHGLPDCAGVALGVDRLVMLASGTTSIADVIPFPIDRA